MRTRILKAIFRVERAVAHELINTSMERVGTGPRDRVDHATGGKAILRRVVAGQYRKLLDCVHTCVSAEYTSRTRVRVVVDDHAIEPVDVLLGPISVNGHLHSQSARGTSGGVDCLVRSHLRHARLKGS